MFDPEHNQYEEYSYRPPEIAPPPEEMYRAVEQSYAQEYQAQEEIYTPRGEAERKQAESKENKSEKSKRQQSANSGGMRAIQMVTMTVASLAVVTVAAATSGGAFLPELGQMATQVYESVAAMPVSVPGPRMDVQEILLAFSGQTVTVDVPTDPNGAGGEGGGNQSSGSGETNGGPGVATPSQTENPEPTQEPTPEPSPELTPDPSPSQSAQPRPSPSPRPSATPKPTPAPEPTPEPTPTTPDVAPDVPVPPQPTPTPEPTPTPSVTPTETPTPPPSETPEPPPSEKPNPPSHSHSYAESVTTQATCAVAGVKTYACSCGSSYTEPIPATGNHAYDAGTVTTDPTCTSAGVKTFACTTCPSGSAATRTEVVPPIGVIQSVYEPLTITSGFNADVVVEASDADLWNKATGCDDDDRNAGSAAFFSQEYSNSAGLLPLPPNSGDRIITNPVVGGHRYKLADYTGPNSVRLNTANPTATIAVTATKGYDRLSFLGSSGNADGVVTATVTYADGTASAPMSLSFPEWVYKSGQDVARKQIVGLSRVLLTSKTIQTYINENINAFALFYTEIAVDPTKTVTSIALEFQGGTAWPNILAVSGATDTVGHTLTSGTINMGNSLLHDGRCTVCSQDVSLPHVPGDTWQSGGASFHSHKCTICNASTDSAPHTGYATKDAAQHNVNCPDCGYAATENHTFRDGACTRCGAHDPSDLTVPTNAPTVSAFTVSSTNKDAVGTENTFSLRIAVGWTQGGDTGLLTYIVEKDGVKLLDLVPNANNVVNESQLLGVLNDGVECTYTLIPVYFYNNVDYPQRRWATKITITPHVLAANGFNASYNSGGTPPVLEYVPLPFGGAGTPRQMVLYYSSGVAASGNEIFANPGDLENLSPESYYLMYRVTLDNVTYDLFSNTVTVPVT